MKGSRGSLSCSCIANERTNVSRDHGPLHSSSDSARTHLNRREVLGGWRWSEHHGRLGVGDLQGERAGGEHLEGDVSVPALGRNRNGQAS